MSTEFPDRLNNHKRFYYRRKFLRNNATPQELLLWSRLKNSQLDFKFRRQHSIGGYILDFYCPSKRLAIEIDGSQHKKDREYDEIRDKFLNGFGVRVLRFWNNEINTNLNGVLMIIYNELQK